MYKCKKCGAEIDDGLMFCGVCGTKRDDMPDDAVNTPAGGESKKTGIKKFIPVIAAAVVLAAAGIIAAVVHSYAVEEITVSPDHIEVRTEETQSVHYTILPQKASGKKVTWEVSDPGIALVDEGGNITGLSEGACSITVRAGGKSANINVVVSAGPDLNKIYNDLCSSVWADIASDGSYLRVDTNPDNKEDYVDIECYKAIEEINKALGFPQSLYQKMGETRSLDGRQTQTSDDITVSWTYHPDNGLEILYERNQ